MCTAEKHEKRFIVNLVVPTKRQRFLDFVRNDKHRRKFLAELDHPDFIERRYVIPIPPNLQTANDIARMLGDRQAPLECYLISNSRRMDRCFIDLLTALDMVIGSGFGTVISCLPGKLVYFEGEGPGDRFLLHKK